MNSADLAKALEQMRPYIQTQVASGFVATADQIVQNALAYLADDYDSEQLLAQAQRLTHETIDRLRTEQRDWPDVTDCDRLDQAFDDLEEMGVVCRQNFSCCGNCGSSEIWDEIRREQARGREITGYAFYHMQTTEGAVEGHGLYLHYGSTLKGEGPAVAVGHQIAATIRARGLKVDWDGTWDKCVAVQLDWKRRLPVG